MWHPSEDVHQECVSMNRKVVGNVNAGYRGQWHMYKREVSNYKTEYHLICRDSKEEPGRNNI